jgi:AraC-like DNA-binding protein
MMIEYANNADVIGSRALMPALHGVADQVTGGLPWSRLRRVVEYVQTNLTGELSLAELSALVHMSPYHFARLFKKSIGVSPRQFVIRRRIAAAKLLLAERSRPMGEVALAVGFSSKSHFTTIFLRITGVTPGHYRAAVHVGDAFGTSGDGPELLLSPGDGPELGRGPAGEMAGFRSHRDTDAILDTAGAAGAPTCVSEYRDLADRGFPNAPEWRVTASGARRAD